jgi:prepilin-type N-terminal cleavage/methylation domain-containing protein
LKRRISGFTLVEIMVVLVIVGIIGSLTVTLILHSKKEADVQFVAYDVQGEARIVMLKLTKELTQGREVLQPLSNAVPTNYIVFQDFADNTVSFIYDQNARKVFRSEIDMSVDPPETYTDEIGSNILDLNFLVGGRNDKLVTIHMISGKVTKPAQNIYDTPTIRSHSLTSRVYLRNL